MERVGGKEVEEVIQETREKREGGGGSSEGGATRVAGEGGE